MPPCYTAAMAANPRSDAGRSDFATTHWSLVVAAGDRDREQARDALSQLCETYWYPLYAYVRRRIGDIHEARDFTQAFFAHILESSFLADADPHRGRFRAFLLTACKRFLINEWHKARAAKRGGGRLTLSLDFDSGESKYGLAAVDSVTAERLYEQQWAMTLLERVLQRLREEYAAREKLPHFEALKQFLTGASKRAAHAETARALGVSEAAVKVAAHRMRKRYRELLRAEIAQTVRRPEEVDDEIRELFAVLGAEK